MTNLDRQAQSEGVLAALATSGIKGSPANVAVRVIAGKSNKEIASELFVTEKTVKFHITSMYKRAGVSSRAQFIVKYLPYVLEQV